MEANEIPEKIYVPTAGLELTDKLPCHIEYTRTDAFIEKACVKLKKLMYDNLMFQGTRDIGSTESMKECLSWERWIYSPHLSEIFPHFEGKTTVFYGDIIEDV